jgi:hypothetical protein
LINERREAAKANHTLLNEQFRSRLAQYVRRWRSQRALEAIPSRSTACVSKWTRAVGPSTGTR